MQYTQGNYINYNNLYPLLINILRNWLTKLLRRFTEFSRNFRESLGAYKVTPPKAIFIEYYFTCLLYFLSIIYLLYILGDGYWMLTDNVYLRTLLTSVCPINIGRLTSPLHVSEEPYFFRANARFLNLRVISKSFISIRSLSFGSFVVRYIKHLHFLSPSYYASVYLLLYLRTFRTLSFLRPTRAVLLMFIMSSRTSNHVLL